MRLLVHTPGITGNSPYNEWKFSLRVNLNQLRKDPSSSSSFSCARICHWAILAPDIVKYHITWCYKIKLWNNQDVATILWKRESLGWHEKYTVRFLRIAIDAHSNVSYLVSPLWSSFLLRSLSSTLPYKAKSKLNIKLSVKFWNKKFIWWMKTARLLEGF